MKTLYQIYEMLRECHPRHEGSGQCQLCFAITELWDNVTTLDRSLKALAARLESL